MSCTFPESENIRDQLGANRIASSKDLRDKQKEKMVTKAIPVASPPLLYIISKESDLSELREQLARHERTVRQ